MGATNKLPYRAPGRTLVSYRLLPLLLLLLLLASSSGVPLVDASGPAPEKECRLEDSFRLPRRVQPTNYQLLIRPNLNEFTFSAKLTIHLLVHQDPHDGLCALLTNRQQQQHHHNQPKPNKKSNKQKRAPPLACDRSKIILHAHKDLKILNLDFTTTTTTTSTTTNTGFRYDDDGDNDIDNNDSIGQNNQVSVQVRELCRDFKNELLVVGLDAELYHQTAGKLQIHYTGPIRNDMHGFFRSEYTTNTSKSGIQTMATRHMAITHFQAPHARKALPCFDEPNFKSNFNLVIEHASHLKALSNTHVIKTETVRYARVDLEGDEEEEADEEVGREVEGSDSQQQAFTRVYFAQTPRMSTYLLAFAVGEFDHIETQVGQLQLAIHTTPGRAHLARYALKNAARAYGALRDYFDIDQPLKKIDFVAVRELDAGAMENWGLITFTEHFLLLDEQNTTPDDINYATDSITHELSHQWFGNLVTMKWWDDLWLNEGFATWITQLINQKLHPNRDGDLLYLLDALNVALNSDAAVKTHPIRNRKLTTAKEIEESFDDITYEKASAVIRMLNDYLGADQFKLGIKSYLRSNLYQNTEALDLWSSLESATQLNVRDLMTSWIDQPGFPLIRARLTQDGRSLRVDQERFLERQIVANGSTAMATNELATTNQQVMVDKRRQQVMKMAKRQKWILPLAMWISDGRNRTKLYKVILSERGANIKLPLWFNVSQPGHWLKLNAQFGGFYRVSYDDLRLFKALKLPIQHKLMLPSDRLNFICDTFALLQNEKLDMVQFDEALSWFQNEDNDAVLDALARYIASLEAHQYPTSWPRRQLLIDYFVREGKFELNKANSWLRQRTRANVASALVVIEHEGVTRDAINLFERLGGLGVPASFRIPIFSAVARSGTTEQTQRLIQLVQQLDTSQSQARLVDAMTESITAGAGGGSAKQIVGESGGISRHGRKFH